MVKTKEDSSLVTCSGRSIGSSSILHRRLQRLHVGREERLSRNGEMQCYKLSQTSKLYVSSLSFDSFFASNSLSLVRSILKTGRLGRIQGKSASSLSMVPTSGFKSHSLLTLCGTLTSSRVLVFDMKLVSALARFEDCKGCSNPFP